MVNSLISIIIPTYNRVDLIADTLNSIINQTYENWECIIVDDHSTDNTDAFIEDYVKKDLRFKYFKRPANRQKGANACRNYGFEQCSGKYIKWFDSDDIMHSDFLLKQVVVLEKDIKLDFCASFSNTFVDEIQNVVAYNNPEIYINNKNSLFNYIIGKLIFLTPSPLWRREFLENKSLYDETLHNAHETDFNFSRLIEGANFFYSNEVLIYIRRGHESIDSDSNSNINSLKSMFTYYQKVFLYLNSPSPLLKNNERKILSHYILYKQLMVLYNLRKVSFSVFITKKNILLTNLLKTELKFNAKVKILFGIFLSILLKKGFVFFDLNELKRAKNYL